MSRPPSLRRGIEKFKADLGSAKTDAAARELCAEACNAILANYSGASAKQTIYLYRKAAREVLGQEHPALEALVFVRLPEARTEGETENGEAAPAPTNPAAAPNRRPGRMAADEDGFAPGPAPDTTPAAAKVSRATLNAAGRRPRLQETIAAFTQRLRDVESEQEVVDLWAKELAHHAHLAESTQLLYITKYRADIRNVYGDESHFLKVVVSPTDLVNSVTSARNAGILDEHRNLVGIRHWRKILARATKLLDSDDPLVIGIGLMVLTGRRPVEIYTSGLFERSPLPGGVPGAFEKWQVLFAGQAKTRAKEGTRYGQSYHIPVLAPARQIVEAYERLRTHPKAQTRLSVSSRSGEAVYKTIRWNKMTSDEFARALRMPLREAFTEAFDDLWPETEPLTPYSVGRSLYVTVAYQQFCSRSVSMPSYICAILGHSNEGGKGLETAHAYMDYYLMEEDEEPSAAAVRPTRRRLDQARERIRERLEAIGKLPQGVAGGDEFEDMRADLAEALETGTE
ncbi:protelomerase family protein [Xanthobacter sp. DSM 14520]|uniref:protelomerase family protein n=1 Tax=Xanthobacter autotrophicus (strain ATCC BAA-1158 / Py2) TaxID=78245 RepID=UPI00372C071B